MSGIFAGIGKLEAAPGYSLTSDFPVWLNITPYVRAESTTLAGRRGRQSELDTIEAGELTCILDNTDLRFTPGYTSGPYGSNWTAGCPIRYSETIGSRTFVHFTGALQFPDTDNWAPIGYQEVYLSATDGLGSLARGAPFISTLGAYIQNGAADLVHYWPMNEAAGPNLKNPVGAALLVERRAHFVPGIVVSPSTGDPVLTYGSATPIDGDELRGLTYNPNVGGGSIGALMWADHTGTLPSISVTSGNSVALITWINWTRTTVDGPLVIQVSSGTAYAQIALDSGTGTYALAARDDTSANATQATTIPPNLGVWRCVALRISEPSGLCEFWHHGDAPVTFTLGGAPSAMTLSAMVIGTVAPASMCHMQIRVGANAYTRTQHLAQVTQGYLGLDKQLSGARINTVLDYAGVPAAKRAIDAGVSPVAKATLANQPPAAAVATAVDTERGRFFVDGTGRYVFHDRPHIYNA